MRLCRRLAGYKFRLMTFDATDLVKQRLALEHFRIAGIAQLRHREVLRIKRHQLEQLIAHFDILVFGRVA